MEGNRAKEGESVLEQQKEGEAEAEGEEKVGADGKAMAMGDQKWRFNNGRLELKIRVWNLE